MTKKIVGIINKISGPMVIARSMKGVAMYEVVKVGKLALMGEVIKLSGDTANIQVYEDTVGICPGEPVEATGDPLLLELGPGLLGEVFDGIQRPLTKLRDLSGIFISRGLTVPPLSTDKKWDFVAKKSKGDKVSQGDIIGTVMETEFFEHKIMLPPNCSGTIKEISSGSFTIKDTVAELESGQKLTLTQKWPAKIPRPIKKRKQTNEFFITGQRVLDCLFPIVLGGTACIPGGFGTGKTVLEQSLAKFSMADIIVYVGCGERGNEMTEVLREFPELNDPRTGSSLMKRTVLVVNTSNMPVAAREVSVYVGVTIAEYFRDMGANVAVMVDSTSRWAEALREISSRLEEMPGEEGYPTYLGSRLAAFYERAGAVDCISSESRSGSVTIVGAVSPAGGDFSEPVTQSTMRLTGAFWGLDSSLAHRRHYPSINWHKSYTFYFKALESWFLEKLGPEWSQLRSKFISLLAKEGELQEIVQLVGPDTLQEKDRLILEISRMFREGFLQQNAMSDIDASCPLEKQLGIMQALDLFYTYAQEALKKDFILKEIIDHPIREDISRMKEIPPEEFEKEKDLIITKLNDFFKKG